MLVLTQYFDESRTKRDPFPAIYTTVTLPIDSRIKSRIKVLLDNGEEAGIMLQRGLLLRGGDYLTNEDESIVVRVLAKEENVSTAYCKDPLLLAKAAYHLGNRHVPLQIESSFVRYQHDHVLDDMLHQMNVSVTTEQAPFEPEAGAYQSAAGGHHHSHENDTSHHHSHHTHKHHHEEE